MTKFLSLVGFARRSAGPQIRPSMLMRGHHVDTIKHGGGLKMPRVPLKPLRLLRNFGAGEGIRTLDPNLGKVVHSISGAFPVFPRSANTLRGWRFSSRPFIQCYRGL
ncbi:MAG: hypothetical protein ACJ8C0_13540, partial [Microvirga sp.]